MTYLFVALAAGFLAFILLDLPVGYYVVGMLPVLAVMLVVRVVATARAIKERAGREAPPEVLARIDALRPAYQSRAESWPEDEPMGNAGTLLITADSLVFLDWETAQETRVPLAQISKVRAPRRYAAGERRVGKGTVIGSGQSSHTMAIDWDGASGGGSAQWWVANRAEWRRELERATGKGAALR